VFSFDVSVMDTWTALLTGGTIVSLTREEINSPRDLHQTLAGSRASVWVSTPTFAQICLAEPRFGPVMLPRVRRFLFCGETLPPEVAGALLDRFPDAEVWNTYGPTEATVATTSVRVTRDVLARYSPLPIGYPMPRSRLLVLDEHRQQLPDGERGELVIVGPNVSPGYLHRPDLTATAFFEIDGERAYRTGDVGYSQDGLLFFQGRMDGQIKLHGYRLELGDVEAHVAALPGVRAAVVLPVLRDGRIDSLTAFVVLREPSAEPEREVGRRLRAALAARLPDYMLPRKFRILDSFPMNANGKADRRALADLLNAPPTQARPVK
jgi:D-alanine--poly(phosphoribitol) ligase subunit 1